MFDMYELLFGKHVVSLKLTSSWPSLVLTVRSDSCQLLPSGGMGCVHVDGQCVGESLSPRSCSLKEFMA